MRNVRIHGDNELELERRIDTFVSALHAREGSVMALKRRRAEHGWLADIQYDFPVRDSSQPAADMRPAGRANEQTAASARTDRV